LRQYLNCFLDSQRETNGEVRIYALVPELSFLEFGIGLRKPNDREFHCSLKGWP
jgi:hypothetical protein